MLPTLLIFSLISISSAVEGPPCSSDEFLKTFQCIGGLSEFVTSVDKYNLTVGEDREKFTAACKEASDCFDGTECLHDDRLKLFLETYCGYSTFLETDFLECKKKLDGRKESQCEKNFKSFFDNTMTEDVKCGMLEDSLKCVKKEVSSVCGEKDASNIGKYLENMSQGLSCDEVKKMNEEKKND
ncbi:hypothetical protein L3Y34_005986 [Caenorhabditis briggsae]|uniref:T20D4.11-like domain-containing protein n=1 Tax=Caenorhabditis briggsae TaxID=6238 RepID=A0AAE8ZWN1_CAEBR|nr:hypothetical protein L3Y34_005986 [Caenorhabditis briggsae]